jgi:hypothetical protein
MPDTIHTDSAGRNFALSDDIILCQAARTRTLFRPAIHGGGVRGFVIRQKIGEDGQWQDLNEVDFRSAPADTAIHIELDTEATTKLFTRLSQLYEVQSQGVTYGHQSYQVAREGEAILIDDTNKAQVIQRMLEQDLSEEFWDSLRESNPDLAAQLAAGAIQQNRLATIREFEDGLASHPDDESHWQDFFQNHPWILESVFSAAVFMLGGESYVGGKRPIGRNGVGGVATDFLFADDSTKSFAVIEIKTPGTELVGSQYRGNNDTGYDNETYSMHSKLSGSVVQVRNQITVAIDSFESTLGPGFQHKINRIHPKGVLIIGSLDGLSERQQASFNQFRHGLFSLTVITYDEVLTRLKALFAAQPTAQPEAQDDDTPINLDDIAF